MPVSSDLTNDPLSTAEQVVARLGLVPLDQEGGFFRRTAESGLWVRPRGAGDETRAYSVIYALFTPDSFSALHVLTTDEVWCWHAGHSLESLRLHPDGRGEWVWLGIDLAAGQVPQDVVPAGVWQGTRLVAGGSWALVSCVVAPEFQWQDFTLGERATLLTTHPEWAEGITQLTREETPRGRR